MQVYLLIENFFKLLIKKLMMIQVIRSLKASAKFKEKLQFINTKYQMQLNLLLLRVMSSWQN